MTASKSELITALELLAREKGIQKDEILKMIEGAMVTSLRKYVGKNAVIEAFIDPRTAEFTANVVKKIVETVVDAELEISLAEAKRIRKDAAVGEELRYPAPAADFARIAAQTAKQVLLQKSREVERDSLYDEFKPKELEVITGAVHRFVDRNIIVELGKAEGILPLREQIRRERYGVGSRVRAVILKVDKAVRGPQVLLSRAAPVFLRRLFEMEIPEIHDRLVEIVEIARDPGFRAKVAVKSNDPKIDPVGSCVGLRGSRIRTITNELSGERIDLIPFSPETEVFIANALAPAKIAKVTLLDIPEKKAEVTVTDEQLSLAVGKDGQNIRLAARLTGWTLEIKTQTQKSAESAPPPPLANAAPDGGGDLGAAAPRPPDASDGLDGLEGVGPKTVEILRSSGWTDIARLAAASPAELTALEGIGEKTAAKIIAGAQKLLK